MASESYKELLRQAAKLQAQIREHHVIMIRRVVAGLPRNHNLYNTAKPKLDELEEQLTKVIRDYDDIDERIDYLMYKLSIELS